VKKAASSERLIFAWLDLSGVAPFYAMSLLTKSLLTKCLIFFPVTNAGYSSPAYRS